jgi:hypothetical protein
MKEPSVHYYVHPASIGDFAACKQAFQDAGDKLKALYDNHQIDGFTIVIIRSIEEAEEQLIWCAYAQITNDLFPFLCALVQPLPDSPFDLDRRLAEWAFVRCVDQDPAWARSD